MKYVYILLALFLVGCEPDFKGSDSLRSLKTECFEAGGAEFQYGLSGGRQHFVCVFKNEDQ